MKNITEVCCLAGLFFGGFIFFPSVKSSFIFFIMIHRKFVTCYKKAAKHFKKTSVFLWVYFCSGGKGIVRTFITRPLIRKLYSTNTFAKKRNIIQRCFF